MSTSNLPYSKKHLSSTRKIKQTAIPTLKRFNSESSGFEQASRFIVENSALSSNLLTKSPLMKSLEEQNRNLFKSIPSSVIAAQEKMDLSIGEGASQIAATILPKMDLYSITQAYKSAITDIQKMDFRIDVTSQELERVLTNEPKKATENLLFKDTSEPVSELESQLFQIVNQQREILNDSLRLFEEINDTKNKDVTEEPSNEKHDSPAFYKDKMWYFEQIGATMIGLVVSDIVSISIGVDPHNTVLV